MQLNDFPAKRRSSAPKNATNVPKIAVAIVSLGINSSQ